MQVRLVREAGDFLERSLALTAKASGASQSEAIEECTVLRLPDIAYGAIRLGRRRKQRYLESRRRCGAAYRVGIIDARKTTTRFHDAALAILASRRNPGLGFRAGVPRTAAESTGEMRS